MSSKDIDFSVLFGLKNTEKLPTPDYSENLNAAITLLCIIGIYFP